MAAGWRFIGVALFGLSPALIVGSAACGGRSGLDGLVGDSPPGDAGPVLDAGDASVEAEPPCAEAPWIIFQAAGHDADGGYLSSLAAVRADGSERHRLVLPDSSFSLSPSVTPDGKALLYAAHGIQRLDLTTGAHQTIFANDPNHLDHPVASPDNAWIAFTDGVDLHIANGDGTGDRVLVQGPQDGCCSDWVKPAAFSPDGRTLYFVQPGAGGDDAYELWSIGVDGTGQVMMGFDTPIGVLGGLNPSFSPDHSRFVASVGCNLEVSLRIYDLADPRFKPTAHLCDFGLAIGTGAVGGAAAQSWGSNDVIAFILGTESTDLWTVQSSGAGTKNLTAGSVDEAFTPTWAPGCAVIPPGPSF
jgi:hypothetical protein